MAGLVDQIIAYGQLDVETMGTNERQALEKADSFLLWCHEVKEVLSAPDGGEAIMTRCHRLPFPSEELTHVFSCETMEFQGEPATQKPVSLPGKMSSSHLCFYYA